jgi:membrane associated rhomboid family serine protease
VLTCGLVSVLVGTQGGARVCSLSYQKVVQKLELWRLVTSPCVFSSTPELLFGLYLVYFFRVFERQIGSNKYLVFLLFSTAFTTILEVVTLAAFRGIGYSTFVNFYVSVAKWSILFVRSSRCRRIGYPVLCFLGFIAMFFHKHMVT